MTSVILSRIAAARTYAALVSRFPPRRIRSEKSLKQTCEVIDGLMAVRKPSADQLEYLEMLTTLVEDYETAANPTPAVPLSQLLRHLIEAKQVTQVQVAKQTGVSASTLSDVLAGRRSLSVANIKRLAEYFGVEAGAFVRASE